MPLNVLTIQISMRIALIAFEKVFNLKGGGRVDQGTKREMRMHPVQK